MANASTFNYTFYNLTGIMMILLDYQKGMFKINILVLTPLKTFLKVIVE